MKDLYIITGATGGMGSHISKYFSNKGHLLLLDVSFDKLTKLKQELNGNIDVMEFDITSNDDIDKVVQFVKSYGGFKYLLNFAGVSESMGDSSLIYRINLIGQKNLLDALYAHVTSGGVVINTASIAAHTTPTVEGVNSLLEDLESKTLLNDLLKLTENNSQAYGWSKLGIINLTKQYTKKWGDKNARIISVSPGVIETPMVQTERGKNAEMINNLVSLSPAKRVGLPEDITSLVEFLISDRATFITGSDIIIDGGLTTIITNLYD